MTPGSPPAHRQSSPNSVRRRVVGAFTERLALKATAIVVALVLWVVVNVKEPQLQLVRVPFMPTLDSSLVLHEQPPELQALVAGSPSELLKLNATPPIIRRQIGSDQPDTVVIDLRPADVILPAGVEGVAVREIQPTSITLHFEPTWSRKVPVRSAIDLVANPWPGPIALKFDPESVRVSGPRQTVLRVAFVKTVKTTITLPDSLTHLIDVDTSQLGLRVSPSQVRVQLSAAQRPLGPKP